MSKIAEPEQRLIVHFAAIPQGRPSGVASAVYAMIDAQQRQRGVDSKLIIVNTPISTMEGQNMEMGATNGLPPLRRLRKHSGPRVAVLHGIYHIEIVLTHFALRIFNIPYVIMGHGGFGINVARKSPWRKRLWRKFFLNQMTDNASAIHFINETESSNSILSNRYTKIVAPNIICVPSVDSLVTRPGQHSPLTLLFMGRIDIHHKGLDLLIDAFKILMDNDRLGDIRLLIVGPDHNKGLERLQAQVRNAQLDHLVSFGAAVFGDQKSTLLTDADIFIHTSRFEGEPVAVLEAMSYGLPVLVTEGTNLAATVEQYNLGWGCETNSSSIAHCILESLENKDEWQQRGMNGVKWIRENRSADVVTSKLVDAYFNSIQ